MRKLIISLWFNGKVLAWRWEDQDTTTALFALDFRDVPLHTTCNDRSRKALCSPVMPAFTDGQESHHGILPRPRLFIIRPVPKEMGSGVHQERGVQAHHVAEASGDPHPIPEGLSPGEMREGSRENKTH